MHKDSKIYIAGHTGLLGSAILRRLRKEGYTKLIFQTRQQLDLLDQSAVFNFYETHKPEYVIVCAAKVGGVNVNIKYPYDMLYQNIQIQNNLINGGHIFNVKKLLFVASSTIYPSNCEQPITEDILLHGPLDPLHESYGLAKICGIKLCEKIRKQSGKAFFSLVPTNFYGEGDHFEEANAHVIGALISKFHRAKEELLSEVIVQGSDLVQREFLYVDDVAGACLYFLLNDPLISFLNIGSNEEISIKDLAILIKNIIGFQGNIVFDETKLSGRLRRKLDISLANSLGWHSQIPLVKGIRKTYEYYLTII